VPLGAQAFVPGAQNLRYVVRRQWTLGVGRLGEDGIQQGGFAESLGAAEMAGDLDDHMDQRVAAEGGVLAVSQHEVQAKDEVSHGLADTCGHARRIVVQRAHRVDG
jgi:hypothetical protein